MDSLQHILIILYENHPKWNMNRYPKIELHDNNLISR